MHKLRSRFTTVYKKRRRSIVNPNYVPVTNGIELWLDSSEKQSITDSGGAVSQQDDKSGNVRNVTQATGAQQPTTNSVTINGLNAIDFDGSADNLEQSSIQDFLKPADNFTVLCAFKMDVNDSNRKTLFGSSTDTNNRSTIVINTANEIVSSIWDGSYTFKAATLTDTSNPHLVIFTNAAGTVNQYLDGVLSTDTSGAPQTGSANIFKLGGRSDDTQFWNGPIGEFIVYSRVLSTSERLQDEAYLANKWGVSI